MARLDGRRIVFPAEGETDLEEYEVRGPSDHEILVETQYSLISAGTEMTSLVSALRSRDYPVYPGYSNVGIVREAGKAVHEEYPPGTPVLSMGRHSSHIILDLNPDRAGPPEMVAPAGSLGPEYAQKLDENADLSHATFAVLGSVAIHGIRRAAPQLGNSAAIFGQGVVGQLILQLARASGCRPVIGVDLVDARLENSRISGADHTIDAAREDTTDRIMELTGGTGAELLFDATRSPKTIPAMMDAAAHFAKILVVGSLPGTVETDFFTQFQIKELSLMGVFQPATPTAAHPYNPFTQCRNRKAFLDLLGDGAVTVDHLITHRPRWDEAVEIFSMIHEGPGNWMGIVFDWTQA